MHVGEIIAAGLGLFVAAVAAYLLFQALRTGKIDNVFGGRPDPVSIKRNPILYLIGLGVGGTVLWMGIWLVIDKTVP